MCNIIYIKHWNKIEFDNTEKKLSTIYVWKEILNDVI